MKRTSWIYDLSHSGLNRSALKTLWQQGTRQQRQLILDKVVTWNIAVLRLPFNNDQKYQQYFFWDLGIVRCPNLLGCWDSKAEWVVCHTPSNPSNTFQRLSGLIRSTLEHTIRKVKFLSKNSILTKAQHFHEFFTQNFFDNFSREIKVVNS